MSRIEFRSGVKFADFQSENPIIFNLTFTKLYMYYKHHAFKYIQKRIKNVEKSNDLVQDVFLLIFEALESDNKKFKNDVSFARYLIKVAENRVNNFTEREGNLGYTSKKPIETVTSTYELDTSKLYLMCLNKLEKAVVEMSLILGYDFRSIGRILNISKNKAFRVYNKGVEKIKKSLNGVKV